MKARDDHGDLYCNCHDAEGRLARGARKREITDCGERMVDGA